MTDPTPKPLALELADLTESFRPPPNLQTRREAAAELRRQHQAIVELREVVNEFFSLDEALLKDIYGSEFVNAARATLTKHQET